MNDALTLIINAVDAAMLGAVLCLCFVGRKLLKEAKKYKAECEESLDEAKKKRKAAVTILSFAELWRRDMSDDARANLIIEWHERLKQCNVILETEFNHGYEQDEED